ncbi:MAG: glycosyltransferase family 4 protein [Dongiaceae bacterium]
MPIAPRTAAAAGTARRHLLHVFPSFRVGGSQARLATLANALPDRYRHTIVALDGAFDCESRLAAGVERRLDRVALDGIGLAARLRAIRARLRALRPDLLLTYNWGAIEWALANRLQPFCRHVHFEDGFGPDELERQLPRRVLGRRLALSGRSTVVVPSRTLERIALEQWRLSPARVRYIANGVDCARFGAALDPAALPQLAAGPAPLLVGTVAALRPEKNLARLIRATAPLFARFALRLVIVGDGEERPRLQALAAALGLAERVIFTGARPDPERILPLLDVFALSSDTEQMPLTLLEAMAAGRAVASVDAGDVRAMLPAENRRFVVAREDEAGLTDAIGTLLADPALRTRLAAANRRRAETEFSLTRMVATYDRLFAPA